MIGASVFVGGVDVDLEGVGATADAVADVAEDDEAAQCKAAERAAERGAVGCRLRPSAAKVLYGHGSRGRIVLAVLGRAPLVC
jgi:hypothetical protein